MKTLPSLYAALFLSLSSGVAVLGASAPPPIEQVAPDNALASLWCADLASFVESWKGTPMYRALDDERLKESLGQVRKAMEDRKKELAGGGDDGGNDFDAVGWPSAVGASVFTDFDAEMDADQLAYFLYADFGDRADKAWELLARAFRLAAEESKWVLEEEEIDGQPALVATFPEEDLDAGDFDMGPMAMVSQVVLPADGFVITRSGSTLIGASALHIAEDLAVHLGAPPATGRLSGTDGWRDAQGSIGGSQLAVAAFIAPLAKISQPLMAGEAAGAQGVLQALLGDITTVTVGVSAGQGDRQLELSASVVHPGGPEGLFKLLEVPAAVTEPSKAMGDDCINYGIWNIDLSGVPRLIEEILAAVPEEIADEVDPLIRGYMPAINKAFSAMGPRIEMASRADDAEMGGLASLTRIACKDERAALPLVQLWGPQLGLVPTEFQGAQVFASNEPDSPALGISPTALFMGSRGAVEGALRAAGNADASSIGQQALYARAVEAIGTGPFVGWSVEDTVGMMEAQESAAFERLDMLLQVGVAEAFMGDDALASLGEGFAKIDFKALREFVGPKVFAVTQSRERLTSRWMLLTP
ncbi:MAG: hypothetical protein O2819_02630 [Planctomycetota bacterium]|nr:hypothetical protein [Planctomycetota bacterium]